MKLLLLLLTWYIFTNASEQSDKWVIVYEDEKTTIKVKREDYLHHKKMIEVNNHNISNTWELRYNYDNS